MFQPLQMVIHDYGVYWMFCGFCIMKLVFCILYVVRNQRQNSAGNQRSFRETSTTLRNGITRIEKLENYFWHSTNYKTFNAE
ncbi:hypothetical protein Avbf_18141 [Armadillidium vulgare]|nr:hypothetical protein Avbf_18141 [Armadillidium vulgare]